MSTMEERPILGVERYIKAHPLPELISDTYFWIIFERAINEDPDLVDEFCSRSPEFSMLLKLYEEQQKHLRERREIQGGGYLITAIFTVLEWAFYIYIGYLFYKLVKYIFL